MNELKELLKAIEDYDKNENGFLTNELTGNLIFCAVDAKEEIRKLIELQEKESSHES